MFKAHFETQPILPEDHTQDQFIDKLEELCGCKGEGYIKALENIFQMKVENDMICRNIQKALGGRGNVNDPYGSIRELVAENEELKVEAKKIEAAVRSSRGDALELCLPIWYGEDEDEDED